MHGVRRSMATRLRGIISRVVVACAGVMFAVLSAGAAQASAITDTAFVNRVYNDLLNRPADSTGLSVGLNAIATNNVQPWLLGVLGSAEYRTDLVGAFYQTLLSRGPAPIEQFLYVGLLASTTDEGVEANIAGSDEYLAARGGGTNSGFLQAVFQDFLNRAPGADLATFLAALTGGATREQVAATILASSEYHQDLLGDYYDRFLGRPLDTPGAAAFLPGMNNGTLPDEKVIAIILASPEYYRDAQQVAAVPEPATWVMMILGFGGLAMLASRRKRYAAPNATFVLGR
jgi:hypothetical protein